jgi:hypothetical protein
MKIPLATYLASAVLTVALSTADATAKPAQRVWTDPETALREDPDFAVQGEYRTAVGETSIGAQVVALGKGEFEAYISYGGLPGAGWQPGNRRTPLKGARKDGKIAFAGVEELATATLENGSLSLTAPDDTKHQLERVERRSPTLEAKPPEGAVVLFDGSSADAWENGKIENGHLAASGCTTKQRFGDYTLHLEFRTPYMPDARGQQRGNSGVYHGGRWETQILDSFGLEGEANECGGIYSVSKPRLNLCLPPLSWQTYDVDFTAAKFDASGKRLAWPRITVRLNGTLIHENLELARDFTAAAPLSKPLESPEGPVFLQAHGNPVVFRNIWIMPGRVK